MNAWCTPAELWLFIVGRVVAAFGLGLLAAQYLPGLAVLGWPALAVGLLVLAEKGFIRGAQSGDG